ncbi:MAG: glycerol kinase GlpK [Frankia sp.]
MATFVVAIDQGTTGSTAVVVGEDGRIAGRGYQEFPQHYPRSGWVEHDPLDLWRSSVEVVGQAVADAGIAGGDLAGLGITNQRETTVCWDRSTGAPVTPAIVWQDRRTAAIARRLAEGGGDELIRRKTGLLPDAYFAGTKMRWLLDNVDGLRKRAEAGEIAFGTVDSWLIWNLTGGEVFATDVTNASRTLLMDLATLAWDDELLDLVGVPRSALPEIRPSAHVFGTTRPEVFNGLALPIAGILGDQQSALFAQACFEPGQVKNTYGTGSFMLMNTGTDRLTRQRKLLTTVAVGFADPPTEYALEGSILVTGAAVQWLRDELGIIGTAAETEELARAIDSTDDLWFVPALTGLGAPHWDPHARGLIIGISRGTSRAQLARATLESIAYQSTDVARAIVEESGNAITELRADGGAAGNGWLMQYQADVLGVPVDVPESIETTSLGSAFLAGLDTGVWSDRAELQRRRRTARRYEPTMSADQRETLLDRWHQAVDRSRGWAVEES